MFYIKKCVSDRNYLLRYPEFAVGEHGTKKEEKAIRRMNDFYETMVGEIIAYCGELASEQKKILYMMDVECTLPGSDTMLTESEEISVDTPISVHLALVLRNRPAPTKRLSPVHTWKEGYLVK